MSNTIRTCLMASAAALVLAGCQSRSADAPASDAEEEPVMLAAQSLRHAVSSRSIVPDEPGAPQYREYLDPERYDYRFDDSSEIDCTVARSAADLISLGPLGGEPTRFSRRVEGSPCAA